MDVDVFVAVHRHEWQRLEQLTRRRRRLSGAEVDELVTLYRRTATHLSTIRSAAPDPVLVGRLSTLTARARSAVTAPRTPAWRDALLFLAVRFPAAVYRSRRWWGVTAVLFFALAAVVAAWVAHNPEVRDTVAAPEDIRRLTRPGGDFETYYSSAPAGSFAAQVATNNAWVTAGCLALGILLGLPVVFILISNAMNVGVSAGLMADAGRLDVFFGLITPHGLLELTAVFIAAGVGMRLGWTVIDPGPRTRAKAIAEEGRIALGMAVGLALVLVVSGVIEAFVTPSGLPTWARIAIGVTAEALFLAYVVILGRRAEFAGEHGDVASSDVADELPTVA
ncbi:stage II sporulation protein M [Streptomyces sp. SID3343]|uniref:stage II sporulation protein M n=1 Tax=Streptomyces sp. SID3343 TaxID=2690260 RepID=UPI0013705180|nr:stage II sporulation protein M [Streptomyces sp. SID3343]MYW00143.1 stage II sporulation protein M [Streptomyces sp. SID3343]